MNRGISRSILALALFVGTRSDATTIIPFSDAALVDKAPVIVVGRVEGKLPNTTDRAVTDWLVTVEQVLKGTVPEAALDVRVLGGETVGGDMVVLYGAPTFAEGEQVLLFLTPQLDGTYAVFQFVQGAFHVVPVGRRTAAVQDLSEVRVVDARGRVERPNTRVRDFDRFVDWIEARLDGRPEASSYRFRLGRRQLQTIVGRFRLLEWEGLNMRWFEFDGGGSIGWRNFGTQTGMAGGGLAELGWAMAAWNRERTTPVNYFYDGSTSAHAGFLHFDGENVVHFGDPNDEIEGAFDCDEGGTLASAGPKVRRSVTGTFNGLQYYTTLEADAVVNDGIECLFPLVGNRGKYIERLLAHELGHTLGIGHSSENPDEPKDVLREALMYYLIYRSDTRGAKLNSDDVYALQKLYRRSTGGGGGGGGGGGSNCPANTLCLLDGRFQVTATYQNQYNGTSGVAGAIRNTNLSGFLYFGDGNNIELIVKILDFGDVFKVFYGQLTDLRFELKVLDTQTNRVKTYGNTAGECGAIDNNAFPKALTSPLQKEGSGAQSAGNCIPDANTLCLHEGRIRVTGNWTNQYNGTSGVMLARPLTQVTGGMYFFDTSNLELLVKAVDFGTYYWLAFGALSDLGYNLSVTDTVTGTTRTYNNPPGRYCGDQDGETFRK